MVQAMAGRVVAGLMLVMLFVFSADQAARGADGKEPVKKMFSKVRERGRLPAHYSRVVTEEQRQKIYDIQEEYKGKIDPLEAQVKALAKERDEKIAAVLTPDQKKKVEEAETQAKQKKAAVKPDTATTPAPETPTPVN